MGLLRLFLALLCLPPAWAAWAEGGIHLILSESGAAYQEVADSFRASADAHAAIRVWPLAELGAGQVEALTRENNLVVPVGLKATRFVAEHHAGQAAVLGLMVPKVSAEQIPWPAKLSRRKVSFVYVDQPVTRSLSLIDAVFPASTRVGVVISEENAGLVKQLGAEAARRHLALNSETVAAEGEVGPALRRVLAESDVLLLLPDPITINAANVQNVLLTSYRFRLPVVGFSKGLSKAGAVAVAYSSPAQIARQGAQLAGRWSPEAGVLPPAQHAGEFSIAFNSYVARSLGLTLPDEAETRKRLGAQSE